MRIKGSHIGPLWLKLLERLYYDGQPVSPRALNCREKLGVTLYLEDLRNNIFVSQERKLSYKFMIAEWLWIWFGRDDVKSIAQYAPHIAHFSDNGVDFNGSYGIPVKAQWPYVLGLLKRDLDTRQAVIQIYRQPPGPTKDVPCTLSLQFLVRQGKMHVVACMRSSDIWLGLPYDIFNFSMLTNILAAQVSVDTGSLTIHLGSSHLYETNFEAATRVLKYQRATMHDLRSPRLVNAPPDWLEATLEHREAVVTGRPWEQYGRVLLADTNLIALDALKELEFV